MMYYTQIFKKSVSMCMSICLVLITYPDICSETFCLAPPSGMVKVIDSNKDGEMRVKEIYQAVFHDKVSSGNYREEILLEILPILIYRAYTDTSILQISDILRVCLDECSIETKVSIDTIDTFILYIFLYKFNGVFIRYKNNNDVIQLQKELYPEVHRMLALLAFFSTYRWYREIREKRKNLEDWSEDNEALKYFLEKPMQFVTDCREKPCWEMMNNRFGKLIKFFTHDAPLYVDYAHHCRSLPAILNQIRIFVEVFEENRILHKDKILEAFDYGIQGFKKKFVAFGYLLIIKKHLNEKFLTPTKFKRLVDVLSHKSEYTLDAIASALEQSLAAEYQNISQPANHTARKAVISPRFILRAQ